ncbi:MAG: peptidase, partial [Planctomycetota bacterium]
IGLSITEYPWAGDVYETYMTRVPTNPMTGDPNIPRPLFGHGPDFGYFYYGAIWYGDELWNGGRMKDYNEDGLLDEFDALTWDDEENGGRGFREWEPFEHPTLGAVEIGGFRPKFFSQNGPAEQLEHWISVQALFNLEMAKHLPQIDDVSVEVHRGEETADSTTYDVTVSWKNSGKLPTALTQAQLIKIVQEDRVRLSFDSTLVKREAPVVRIVEPGTRDKVIRAGWAQPGEGNSVTFALRTYGVPGVEGEVEVVSTRGGLVKVPLVLGRPPNE